MINQATEKRFSNEHMDVWIEDDILFVVFGHFVL